MIFSFDFFSKGGMYYQHSMCPFFSVKKSKFTYFIMTQKMT